MFDMKKQLRWSKLKVGLVITLALIVLLVTVFFAGSIEGIFFRKIELKVQFQDVRGLRKGAPVWLFGTEVGTVKSMHLDPAYGVIVTVSINKSALKFLRKDAKASIMTMGLLGDMYIELSVGSPQAEPLRPGEMIKGTAPIEFSEIMETAANSIGKVSEFINKLDTFVTKMEKGEGTATKFLTDPAIYDNLNKITQTLSLTLEEIKNSRGTLKMLLEDPSLYQKILSTASSIEELSRTLKESSGTVKRLVEDPSLYDKMLATASRLEEFSRKLSEEKGTLRRLVEDPQLYENLNQGVIQLSSILKEIDQGEGLAGALIKDKELAKDLKETLTELKDLMKDIKDHPKKYFKFSVF